MSIRIAGTGSYVPEKILTNADLEKMVETNDEWIRTRTGIEERHIASDEQATSDLAYAASVKALEMANLSGNDLDAIIVGTITPDYVFPSTGCVLQDRLGATGAFCFDLEAACSGLLYSLEVAYSLMKTHPKRYRHVLVVGAEKLSSITDWTNRNTCVLFGDGAGAVLLENNDNSDSDCVIGSDLHTDGGFGDILKMPAGGSRMPASKESIESHSHFIHMEGKEVFKLAVNAMVSAGKTVLDEAGITPDEVKLVIPHQANSRIILAVAPRLGVPEERVFININHYGNTSAASIGICLDEAVRSGRIDKGDYVLLTAFGGGLTWGAMLLKF
ncbi:MAG: ketoacyl-ACP synthase III [Victivallales bacterium]|jgi:3-oxoacyl-[acyl-carrier-protein] synthase-3|nr:ketoacyl-ACP synthase III [Victivallales bacterium]